jgi:hypothetical protein
MTDDPHWWLVRTAGFMALHVAALSLVLLLLA